MGRKNNNKKKNKGGRKNNAGQQNTAKKSLGENLPSFHRPIESDTRDGLVSGVGDYYDIYKRSTKKFWNWMKENLPDHKMDSVNDLSKGVNELFERTQEALRLPIVAMCEIFVAPQSIIDELSKSIRYRQLVTDNRFAASGDKGHEYIIETLKYCRSVLKYGRRMAQVMVRARKNEIESGNVDMPESVGNAFALLAVKNEEESDDEDGDEPAAPEVDVKTIHKAGIPFASPVVPDGEEIDIDALLNGDDRFQCMALLNTMDDYMCIVHQHYGLLKNHLRGQEMTADLLSPSNIDSKADGILQLLMECTVVANMATETIQSAENSLKIDHPHISTFYHVLTVVFLLKYVVDIEKMLLQKNDGTKDMSYGKFGSETKLRHAVIDLVATIVETAFHNIPGGCNFGDSKPCIPQITDIVKAFSRKYGTKGKMTELNMEFAQPLFFYVACENSLAVEQFPNLPGMEPHSWLKRSAYIGGDSSILNTHCIIQKVLDVTSINMKLIPRAGFWGKRFDEMTNPAIRIRGDLDDLFAGCILPETIHLCMRCPLQCIPDSSHLLTLLDLFQRHIKKNQKGPIPVSVSFSFHTMLTAIFVLQGDGDLARIASITKESYNKLFAQLDALSEPSKDPPNAPIFYANVCMYKQLVEFAKPPKFDYSQFQGQGGVDPGIIEKFTYWNPLLGGEYMLLCTYLSSIGLGSATVDTLGQLRFTLHLYNALKARNPSLSTELPFLERVDKIFSKTKAVWVGGRPTKGSYAKHFFMSWGHSIASATQLASKNNIQDMNTYQKSVPVRSLDEILPEHYSASYPCVVQHIFSDDESVREYTVLNPTKESTKKLGGLYDLLTRVNMTRDSIDDDEDILSMNLTAVGCILLKFTNKLSEEMGWDTIISQYVARHPELRTGKTMGGRKMKEGGFLASDLNIKRQGISLIWGMMLSSLDGLKNESGICDPDKISTFTKDFFSKISHQEYTYFVEESKLSFRPPRRNPLEGPYPYGRTGLTMRDPLAGFMVCKLNKAGEPDSRIVFPGKLTPFVPDQDGCAEIIFTQDPNYSKVEQLPNGRYRHIASYTLDELIDLGWDGSWYRSSRANHVVKGQFVPFIFGYDSDEEDEYEPFDVEPRKREGTIGWNETPMELRGKYMSIRKIDGEVGLMQIN